MAKHIFKWKNNLEREEAIRGNGKNKLGPYRIFKSNYFTEKYLHNKSPRLRSAMAKFRCGIAPINIEIGRYYGISANKRFCHLCSDVVEDEIHVVASELKDPICHSNECQIGSFSSEAAMCFFIVRCSIVSEINCLTLALVKSDISLGLILG